jgi:NAD(P)-dependent dehydrogenase (short-subunit alcohol dehydrogenase family)
VSVAVVTGSTGLIGAEAAAHFGGLGLGVVGIDNDMRSVFFGREASTAWTRRRLEDTLGSAYRHHDLDIRDREAIDGLFRTYGAASQPDAAIALGSWRTRSRRIATTRSAISAGRWSPTPSASPPLASRWADPSG